MTDVSLNKAKRSISELEKRYAGFNAPGFRVKIDGADVTPSGMAISSLMVETTSTKEADVVTFAVNNAFDAEKSEFLWLGEQLALGKELEVHLGYVDKLEPVFYGFITSVKVVVGLDGTPELQVTALDLSFKLMRGRTFRAYADKKISDIVKAIGHEHGLSCKVDDTQLVIPMLMRSPQSDFQFLHDLAQSINYEFLVVGKTLYFRKKNRDKDPFIELRFGMHLARVEIEHNLSEQVTQVQVRGWDVKEQKPIEAVSNKVDKIGSNSRTGPDLLKAMLGNAEEVYHLNVKDRNEAQILADAVMNERALRLVTGEAECLGIPELRAGRYIKLEGLGERLNQIYYVSRAVHRIDESGYTTTFTFQGNAV